MVSSFTDSMSIRLTLMINEASYCGQVFLEWNYVGISNIGPPFVFPAGFESSILWRKLRSYKNL